MPLPLLALLGLGGLAGAHAYQGYANDRQRTAREGRLEDALGTPGLPGLGGSGVAGQFALEGNAMGEAQIQAAITMLSDPRTAAAGQAILTNAFSERGLNSRYAAGQAGQDRRQEDQQEFTAAQNDINRGIRADEFDRTEARLESNFDRTFNQDERFHGDQMTQRANQHAQSLQLENIHRGIPTGYEIMSIDPQGNRQVRPQYGGQQWQEAFTEVTTTTNALTNTKEMIDLAQKHGRKLTGPIRLRMEALRGQIVSDLAKARDLGVLTPGELEFLGETGAPEITGLGGTTAASAIGGYQKIFEILQQKAGLQQQLYGSLDSYGPNTQRATFGTSIKLSEGGTTESAPLPPGFEIDKPTRSNALPAHARRGRNATQNRN